MGSMPEGIRKRIRSRRRRNCNYVYSRLYYSAYGYLVSLISGLVKRIILCNKMRNDLQDFGNWCLLQ